MNLVIVLLCFIAVVLLYVNYTLLKVRRELNEKLISEISEIRKLLEKIADKS